MKFIEANNIFLFTLFSYLLSPYKSNLVRDISSRLRILESTLQSSFMKLVLGVMKFWQRRKKWEVDSFSRLQEHSRLIVSWKLCLNLCSSRHSSLHVVLWVALSHICWQNYIHCSESYMTWSYVFPNLTLPLNRVGGKEFAKYSDLQKICLILVLFRVQFPY